MYINGRTIEIGGKSASRDAATLILAEALVGVETPHGQTLRKVWQDQRSWTVPLHFKNDKGFTGCNMPDLCRMSIGQLREYDLIKSLRLMGE